MSAGKRPASAGFTLIELLVTLAVVIILATMAVPGFQNLISTNRLAASYNEILSGLNYARSEAVKRRKHVTFEVLSTSGVLEYKVFVGSHGDSITELLLNRNVESVIFGSDSFWVTFDPLGRRDGCSEPDICQLSIENDKTIVIGLAGRIGKPLNETQ